MNWRDIETAIQGDLDAEKLRQQRRTLRSESINDGWWELWTDAISCLTADVGELDQKLQNARVLSLGNNLSVVKMDEYHYLLQNPAFPQIGIDLVCNPAKSVTVTGTMCPSASRSQQIHPRRFTCKRPEFPSGMSPASRPSIPSWEFLRKRDLCDRFAGGERCRRSV